MLRLHHRLQNIKENNRGFSLLELIVAMGIAGVVSLMLMQLMSTTTAFHRSTSSQSDLQRSSQEIAQRMERAIQGANWIYAETSAGGDVLLYFANVEEPAPAKTDTSDTTGTTEKDKTFGDYKVNNYQAFYYDNTNHLLLSDGAMVSGQPEIGPGISAAGTKLGVSGGLSAVKKYLISQNVQSFQCSLDAGEVGKKATIGIDMTLEGNNGRNSYHITTSATTRNDVKAPLVFNGKTNGSE